MKSFAPGLILGMVALAVATNAEERLSGPNSLRTAEEVVIYRESAAGQPTYVAGHLSRPTAAGDELTTMTSFLEQHADTYHLTAPDQELTLLRSEVDRLGMRHLRLQQDHLGVRVLGGELVGHFAPDGVLKAVNGTIYPSPEIDITPAIVASDAIGRARVDLESFFGPATPGEPELVVFPWNDDFYLCWRVFLYSEAPMGRWEYLVDAHTGDIVFNANRIMDANDIGTGVGVMGQWRYHIDTDLDGSQYQMRDYTRQLNNDPHGHDGQMPDGNYLQTNIAGLSLPGSIATDSDNQWSLLSQTPAVDGHIYSALMYDYMLHQLGRNGYDDNGAGMLTVVNYSGEGDNNAYWNGSQIVVWSYSSGWRSLAGCPDVIAHEWAHAITEYCSDLVYQSEPGALNESFSDMVGAAFEFLHDTLDSPDWLMGENGQISGAAFRDMANPHNYSDPDYYGTSDPYWVDVDGCVPSWTNDYCGVHTNSGVGNKWFYLLSDGGTHHDITVSGIGAQNAVLIAYRANRYYWTGYTDYHNGALGTISAANDLDTTGAWATQVAAAWNAVGVATPGPTLVFSYPNDVPDMVAPYSEEIFEVVVSGSLGGIPLSGSGRLHYSINGAGWLDISMTETSPNHYEAVLPGLACNEVLEYYLSAQDASMAYWYDPDPGAPHRAFPTTGVDTVFADNFETDMGWSVGGSVVDGAWDRGVPVGGGDRGDPPADFDGSGSCYLTDNVDDNSDVDDGTTLLTSPSIDLSSGDAAIHYARWYSNDLGADPNNDVMRVWLSNDNGSSWIKVDSAGPVEQAGGGWFEVSFLATDFLPPTDQMRLRFEVSDLSDPSVVEAGVDDVTVTRYVCELVGPVIVTSNLPDWTVGVTYSQQLLADGGTGPLAFSDKFGDLAAVGLGVEPTGTVSGTPATAGPVSFTAVVIDSLGLFDEQPLSFTISEAVTFVTTSLPDWTAGAPYSQLLQATGGTGSLAFNDKLADLTGTGLTFAADGLLSGTPGAAGPIGFTAQAVDQIGGAGERPFSFTINPELQISAAAPDGLQGYPYSYQLASDGGTGQLTWSDIGNNLIGSGLVLLVDGMLEGTPISAGQLSFTAGVTDQGGGSDEQVITIHIDSAVSIATTTLPDWTVGGQYSQFLAASGGWGDLSWTDRDGDLATTGLALSAEGMLTGVPLADGPIAFVAMVTDSTGATDEQTLGFTINPAMQLETPNLPDWTSGEPYSQAITLSGGTPPIEVIDFGDSLVGSGLTLDPSGVLSGTPLSAGAVSFTMRAIDDGGDTLAHPFTFVINEIIGVVSDSLPDGKVGEAYSFTIATNGGTGTLSFDDRDSDLSGTGLVLSSLGTISGTPAAPGLVGFTAVITDEIGAVVEQPLEIRIAPPYVCGDINGSGDGPDIADLTFTVSYMFLGGPPPPMLEAADVNGSGYGPDIVDLTFLVSFMFHGGSPLMCPGTVVSPGAATAESN